MDFTHEELVAARAALADESNNLLKALLAALKVSRYVVTPEIDATANRLGLLNGTLQYALLGDEATAEIAVRCDCGTVFLKARTPDCEGFAYCMNCGMPHLLLAERLGAAETRPCEASIYEGVAL